MLWKTELGRVLFKLSLFIIVLLCIDLVLSGVMKFAENSYFNGENKYRAAIEEKSDVIILGASKAATDYIPSLISKNTGYSVYNLGTTGGTFLVQYPS